MAAKKNPMDILNSIRSKAKLDNEDFSKSVAIRLKPGKIKFQLIANDDEHLFKPRTQHMIPTVPECDDKNEKWMVCDCKETNCPVCTAVNAFKNSGVTLEDINEAYSPKYPYKSLRSVFTGNEHYLLLARVLADNADDGSYLPKDAQIGSTHLIQFPKSALNGLMSAYEDMLDDADGEDVPALFAIFDGDKVANSVTITARISYQPYSCNFTFGKAVDVNYDEVDKDKLNLLVESPQVPEEHYEKCVKRIKDIQNYFIKDIKNNFTDNNDDDDDDLPFTIGSEDDKSTKKSTSTSKNNKTKSMSNDDDDLDLSEIL